MTTLAFSVLQLLVTLVCIIAFSDGLLGDYLPAKHYEMGTKVQNIYAPQIEGQKSLKKKNRAETEVEGTLTGLGLR